MNKKEIIVPALVVGLSVLFAVICLAVFLSNGKSKKWIARKMRIGGLLLTLTAVSCSGPNVDEEVIMCYEPAPINSMWMHAGTQNGIEIKLDTNNVLIGSISEFDGSKLSFSVIDQNENKIQTGSLQVLEKVLVQGSESFRIELDKTMKAGDYSLNLFVTDIGGQDTVSPQNYSKLVIKDE